MTRYPVYLEIDRSSCCMAHVLDIPGCTARGDSREQALGRLPAAIRAAHAWLRRFLEHEREHTAQVSEILALFQESMGME